MRVVPIILECTYSQKAATVQTLLSLINIDELGINSFLSQCSVDLAAVVIV